MKKLESIVWGLIFIVLGLIVGLNTLGIASINIFFDGWWTLFLIIPGIMGLFKDKDKTGNIILLVVGILLLLGSQDIINFETIRYCKIVKESENIIDNSIIHTRIDSSSIIKEEEIINDDESKYDKDIIFIRNCIDPDHENDKILDAFAKFKEGEYDYKSLALHSGVDYNKAYYYTRFINNYPAIERSIKYRNKMNNNDDENINIENYENINNVDSEIVSNTLNGCNYKIKNNNRKRKKRRRKR